MHYTFAKVLRFLLAHPLLLRRNSDTCAAPISSTSAIPARRTGDYVVQNSRICASSAKDDVCFAIFRGFMAFLFAQAVVSKTTFGGIGGSGR